MITPDLIRYIQTSLAAGKSKEQIKSDLMLAGGWTATDVDQAFASLQQAPYKASTGSKAGSFFLTIIIVIVVLGGLAFAANKYFGPVVGDIGKNIMAALPFGHNNQQTTDQTSENTTSVVLPPSNIQNTQPTDTTATQTPQTPTTTATAPAPLPTPGPLVVCKANDNNCLIQAATTCNPATETDTATGTSPKEASTRLYAIIGPQNNQCKFTFSVKSDTVASHQGKGGLCTLSVDDLITTLNAWHAGNFSSTDVDLASQCSGSYFNN